MPQKMAESTPKSKLNSRFAEVRAELAEFVGHSGGGQDGQDDGTSGPGTAIISKPKSATNTKNETPRMYRVIIMNDDYTTMDFVILVLQKFFSKSIEEATQIMLSVHTKGSGICGTFTFEIAETKVYQVNQFSASNHHPLKCIMEKA